MEGFMAVDDAIVRYSKFGKGEKVVVMLHGYGQSLDTFEHIAGQLGKDHTVILLDLPASGFSTWGDREVVTVDYMADITIGLLTKLSVESYYLIGHSMGGYVAAAMVEKDAERISALMLLHSLPFGDTDEHRQRRTREIELILADKKEMLTTINPLKGFAPQNAKRCTEDIEEKIEQFLLTPDEALVATLRGLMQRPDRCEVVNSFAKSKPFVLVLGTYDQYIPQTLWDEVREELSNVSIEVLDGSAHMGYREEPNRTIEIISRFLYPL